jgi:hypothetical protein
MEFKAIMKSKFTEEHITFALRQRATGEPVP